jgi:hypothetical protein
MHDWKQDKAGNTYLKSYMPKMIEEISDKVKKVIEKSQGICNARNTRKNSSAEYWLHGRSRCI